MTPTPETWIPLSQCKTPFWEPNLSYIAGVYPHLYKIIQSNLHKEPLLISMEKGLLKCKTASRPEEWIAGKDPQKEIAALRNNLQAIMNSTSQIVLGTSAGAVLQPLLGSLMRTPQRRLLLLESSAARLALCLHRCDLRSALASGRLYLHVVEPNISSVLHLLEEHNMLADPQVGITMLSDFRAPWSLQDLRNAFKETSAQYQRTIVQQLQRMKNQDVLASRLQRVLLIDCWPGAPQSIHIQAMAKALQEKNIAYHILPLQGYRFDLHKDVYRHLIEPLLRKTLDQFSPDMVVSYAYHKPQLLTPTLAQHIEIPWVQVISNLAYYDTDYSGNEWTPIIEKQLIPAYKQRGAPHPFFVPIMADYVCEEPITTTGEFPIVFVGNSLGLYPADIQAVKSIFANRPELWKMILDLEEALSDFDQGLGIYHEMDKASLPFDSLEEEYKVYRYLLCQATMRRRRHLLEKLLPYGLSIFGNWNHSLDADSPLRAALHDPIPIHKEREIFSRGSLFINIHSVGHVTGPNMRFFNVAGMASALVSDGDFASYLIPGKECIAFSSTQDLIDQVEYYQSHPQELHEIRFHGWQRVQSEWTYKHWYEIVCNEMGLSC